MGQTSIPIPVLFFVKEYECETVHDFIKINLFGYFDDLLENYKNKFKDHESEIDGIFAKVISETESEYFGKNALQDIKNINNFLYKEIGVPGF